MPVTSNVRTGEEVINETAQYGADLGSSTLKAAQDTEDMENLDDIGEELGVDLKDDSEEEDPFDEIFGGDEGDNKNLLGKVLGLLAAPLSFVVSLINRVSILLDPSAFFNRIITRLFAKFATKMIPLKGLIKANVNKVVNKSLGSNQSSAILGVLAGEMLLPMGFDMVGSTIGSNVSSMMLSYLKNQYGLKTTNGLVCLALNKSGLKSAKLARSFLVAFDSDELKSIFKDSSDESVTVFEKFVSSMQKDMVNINVKFVNAMLNNVTGALQKGQSNLLKRKDLLLIAAAIFSGIVFIVTVLKWLSSKVTGAFKGNNESLLEAVQSPQVKMLTEGFFSNIAKKVMFGVKSVFGFLKKLLFQFFSTITSVVKKIISSLKNLSFLIVLGLKPMFYNFKLFLKSIVKMIKRKFTRGSK